MRHIATELNTPEKLLQAITVHKQRVRPASAGAYVAPQTHIEKTVAQIWIDVLKIDQVSIQDQFFALGGNSLQAVQAVSRIQSILGVDFSLQMFFDAPVVADIATLIATLPKDNESADFGRHATMKITKRPDLTDLPLSFSQQRLWFLDQLEPNTAAYNIPLAVKLEGPLDQEALEKSLTAILSRHSALRATFTVTNGQPKQIITPPMDIRLDVVDLQLLDPSEQEKQINRRMIAEAEQGFGLAKGPLFRVHLLRLSTQVHIFLMTVHHIVADGWSIGNFVAEVEWLYQAFIQGKPSPLADLALQYADYAHWQARWIESDVAADQLAYWRAQLGDNLPVLSLPTDYPRPAEQTFRGARESLTLSPLLVERLQHLSQTENTTLFMTLLAVFKVLLYRYCGQDDISVGTFNANRNLPELEPLIGYFINTLVLRTNLSGVLTFREFLAQVRDVTLSAYTHQDMPFDKLLTELNPERSLSHSPFFQVMFVLQNAVDPTLNLSGLACTHLSPASHHANCDLTLWVHETPDGLVASFEYNRDLFEAKTIDRMLQHYVVLLESFTANPIQSIASVPIMTQTEYHKLLITWNDTAADYEIPERGELPHILYLFDKQAAHSPNAVAYLYGNTALTYQELQDQSDHLAHCLQAEHLSPDALVGLYMSRSPAMVVVILGILKAGMAYVPLDQSYPSERLAFMLRDSQPQVIITHSQLQAGLPEHNAEVICIDKLPASVDQSTSFDTRHLSTEDRAYIIYTSGSTGQPKGVVGLHRGIVNRMHWMWEKYPFAENEVCCQMTALGFVDSVWEIFGPMLQGVLTVILPDAVVKDPVQLVEALAGHQVTRIVVVPSLLRAILETQPNLQTKLPYLKYCVTSGELLPLDVFQQFQECMPHCTLLNLYGSSEVSADVTCFDAQQGSFQSSVPIGQPIANTQIFLLDSYRQPVPVGVTGEIYVGGAGIADGYLGQAALTKENFFEASVVFREDVAKRNRNEIRTLARWGIEDAAIPQYLFKTGDLGRFRLDTRDELTLEYLGRADDQVQVRGFRIELGEVESVLNQHASVQESVVHLWEDEAIGQYLAAYFVPITTLPINDASIDILRNYMREMLPAFMIPASFTALAALPRLPNGKLDRQALPKLQPANLHQKRAVTPPQDKVERILVEIWQKVLGVDAVSITDNFFDLGGHSLLAVYLFAQIEERFGQKLPLALLFQASTIESLAEILREDSQEFASSIVVPVQPDGWKRPFFCVTPPRGSVVGFAPLARYIGPEQPFYGLHLPDRLQFQVRAGEPLARTPEEVASRYIAAIRTVQPDGPYLIGGRCQGAYIAFEIARQLQAEGETVSLLAILAARPRSFQRTARHYFNRFVQHVQQRRLGEVIRYALPVMLPKIIRQTRAKIWRSAFDHSKRDINYQYKYQQKVYEGPITVFQTSDVTRDAWSTLTTQSVDFCVIPGTHHSIFHEPRVRQLAEHLAERLDRAEGCQV